MKTTSVTDMEVNTRITRTIRTQSFQFSRSVCLRFARKIASALSPASFAESWRANRRITGRVLHRPRAPFPDGYRWNAGENLRAETVSCRARRAIRHRDRQARAHSFEPDTRFR